MVEFEKVEVTEKVVAIVKFGPPTETDGMRPAEYFSVTLDPSFISPSGEYIRFGHNVGDEIHGWQKASSITIVEILGPYPEDGELKLPETDAKLTMMKVI